MESLYNVIQGSWTCVMFPNSQQGRLWELDLAKQPDIKWYNIHTWLFYVALTHCVICHLPLSPDWWPDLTCPGWLAGWLPASQLWPGCPWSHIPMMACGLPAVAKAANFFFQIPPHTLIAKIIILTPGRNLFRYSMRLRFAFLPFRLS